MEKRLFVNPAINDSAEFLKTSAETGGAYTLVEIELGKSDGPPLHFHKTFSEKFEVKEGVLYLQVGKEKKRMTVGESVTVDSGELDPGIPGDVDPSLRLMKNSHAKSGLLPFKSIYLL